MKGYAKAINKAHKAMDDYVNGVFGECVGYELVDKVIETQEDVTQAFFCLVSLLSLFYKKPESQVVSDFYECAKEFKAQFPEGEEKESRVFFTIDRR